MHNGVSSQARLKIIGDILNAFLTSECTSIELNDPGKVLHVRLLNGLIYEGNTDSMAGRGTIYATRGFKYSKTKVDLHHSFVKIQLEDDKTALAQVVAFFECTLTGSTTMAIYAIVQYLCLVPLQSAQQNYHIFDKYQWEYREVSVSIDAEKLKKRQVLRQEFNVGWIDVNSIIGPATVIPIFGLKIAVGSPKRHDIFHYVDQRFSDRSDWEENSIIESDKRMDFGEKSLKEYMKEHQTQANGLRQTLGADPAAYDVIFDDNESLNSDALMSSDSEDENEE